MTQTSRTCDYIDCGWCYAPDYAPSNDVHGQCLDMDNCPERNLQLIEIEEVE